MEPEDLDDAAIAPGLAPGLRFVCGVCGLYSSKFEANLRRHVEDIHTPRDYSFPCTRCGGVEFPTRFEMTEHRKTCLLYCSLTPPCYADCTWSTKWKGWMPGHKRGHLDMIRRMED